MGGDVLLEQDGPEASVERTNALILQHLAETADEAIRVCGLGNETNARRLEGAERDVGEELSERGRGQVDGRAVVGGGLVAKVVDGLLLEELVSSELERALQEVACGRGTEACGERAEALLGDDLSDAAEEAFVVCDGVELDSCLDAVWLRCQLRCSWSLSPRLGDGIGQVAKCLSKHGKEDLHVDRSESTVGDGTADCASQGESGVESHAAELLGGAGSDLLHDGIDLCRAG